MLITDEWQGVGKILNYLVRFWTSLVHNYAWFHVSYRTLKKLNMGKKRTRHSQSSQNWQLWPRGAAAAGACGRILWDPALTFRDGGAQATCHEIEQVCRPDVWVCDVCALRGPFISTQEFLKCQTISITDPYRRAKHSINSLQIVYRHTKPFQSAKRFYHQTQWTLKITHLSH